MNIKVGDKLRCIRTDGAPGEYSLGTIYTVTGLDEDGSAIFPFDDGFICDTGVPMDGMFWGFELVKEDAQ